MTDSTPHASATIPTSRLSNAAIIDRAKERDFYRYYHQSQRPKDSPRLAPSPPADPIPPPSPPLALHCSPVPSEDQALTAFAQLGALRLNTRRCHISFFDRKHCYILAEATRTLSLQTGQAQFVEDELAWGATTLPKEKSICVHTVNLQPAFKGSTDVTSLIVDDLSADPRFKDNAFVAGSPFCRFYAAVPIRSPNGHSIGTYAVVDDKPRENSAASTDLAFLKDMAITVMRHLEMTRATEDHRRGGIMVKSLGSFVEGKTSLQDWWQDPWESPGLSGPSGFGSDEIPQRKRRSTHISASAVQITMEECDGDGLDSSNTSVKSPTKPLSPESGPPGSSVITPASEITSPNMPNDHRQPETCKPHKEDSLQEKILAPDVKTTFSRAANIILEATEADGAVFFDASVGTFGGLVEDDEPSDSWKHDKSCAVLAQSHAKDLSGTSPTLASQFSMTEGVLRHLLRTYPRGQIFNFDDDSGIQDGEPQHRPLTPTKEKPDSPRTQDDEILLRDIFPEARSVVLCPLWDITRDRWFSGAIIWSTDPMRIFTNEQELSYLTAFGNSVMAEVARLDTKMADNAKADFISSISHELRSPLHGILGSCELLKQTQIDAFQSNMAQTIETCGKTLLDTINHVLDFAKINNLTSEKTKKHKKRPHNTKHAIAPSRSQTNDIMTLTTDVDLGQLTEEVLETVFAGYSFQKNASGNSLPSAADIAPVAIIVDINKSDDFIFRTQPGAWRRVLMNLFGNALKYTEAGFIKVKLQIQSKSGTSDVKLTITDSGVGMSQEYIRTRLWHSFAQEDPLSQGTGLGLSIVKQIVVSLGGEIDVRSEKGLGTKITVSCPLNVSARSPTVRATSADKCQDVHQIQKKTGNMTVAFVGFDDEGDYFPVKNLKNKTASELTSKSLQSMCAEWFGMQVVYSDRTGATTIPDLYIATEGGARELRARYNNNPSTATTSPVIVVCQGAASAQSTTAITVPGQIFECISQPCGPLKLSQALASCLDRHTNRSLLQSTEAGMEDLDIKENARPTLTGSPEKPRPPIQSSFSSPAISTPRSSVSPATDPPKPIPLQPQRSLSILAVDDNPINLRLLRLFIDKLHHTHTLATNGVEAVSVFKAATPETLAKRFDVVLMDINMPEMDGLEATRQIRAHEREAGLPPCTIIALTGLASAEAQQEAFASGINLFLIKPVRLQELEVVLKGVITGTNEAEGPSKNSIAADGNSA